VAVFMPIVCISLIIIATQTYEIQDDITQIWMRDTSDYKENMRYRRNQVGGATTSTISTIAYPRNAGNILTAENLLETRDRLVQAQGVTVSVAGHTFNFEDTCLQFSNYASPCIRYTVLDCFQEGAYDWNYRYQEAWVAQVASGGAPALLEFAEPSVAKLAMAETGDCNCTADSLNKDSLVLVSVAWTTDTSCSRCITSNYDNLDTFEKHVFYYAGAASILGSDTTATEAQLDAGMEAQASQEVATMVESETPYTYEVQLVRPALEDPATGEILMNVSEVLATASAPCYGWDNGALLPAIQPLLIYGSPTPSDYSEENHLTSLDAVQHYHTMHVPEGFMNKLRSSNRPDGAIDLSYDDAVEVLERMKERFEDVMTAGWNDRNAGHVEHTLFADDAGTVGTFGRSLPELAEEAVPLALLYSLVTVAFSALMFFRIRCSTSKAGMAAIGSLLAALGCYGGLGLGIVLGLKVDVVNLWTIPFLMVGVGVDDMYILVLAEEDLSHVADLEERFLTAFSNVGFPITMTSLVNAGMFLMLAIGTDVPAIYNAGYAGLLAAATLFLTMIVSFPAVLYMDMRRREASRTDCLPCVRATSGGTQGADSAEPAKGKNHTTMIERLVYAPLVTTWVGSLTVVVLGLAILTWACIGLQDIPVGLDLVDFFPEDAMAGRFSSRRQEYFPVWPVSLNWANIDYRDTVVQLRMAKEWELTLSTSRVPAEGVQTTSVWTAALATWAVPEEFNLGPCNAADPMTFGRCGPKVSSQCTATWVANEHGLKLKEDGGFCYTGSALGLSGSESFCPVLSGLTDAQFIECIAIWRNASVEYQILAPNLPSYQDGTPRSPITFSEASGNVLFGVNLWETKDYTEFIGDSRENVDEDSTIKGWMAGTPYDYWEQYLTVVETFWKTVGLTLAAGFVISLLFLMLEFSAKQQGTLIVRASASLLGASLITAISSMAVLIVVGFCAWNDTRMSGFTAMSCVISIGLTVEYAVHVVHRYLEAPQGDRGGRVLNVMHSLLYPITLAFLTTSISVVMLLFSDIKFVRDYYCVPLMAATLSSFFCGAFFLPATLALLPCSPSLVAAEAECADVPPNPVKDAVDPRGGEQEKSLHVEAPALGFETPTGSATKMSL